MKDIMECCVLLMLVTHKRKTLHLTVLNVTKENTKMEGVEAHYSTVGLRIKL